ncbi:MAG TPA: glutaredoxin 3 [Polyangiales bacterium]|nr:glutaredoxin 3 [Polyangiales bacterium]
MTQRVQVYTTNYCGFCVRAKALLSRLNIAFDEIDVSEDPDKRDWLVRESGQRTVPQIFIDGRSVGGFVELAALERAGGLRELAAAGASPRV